MDKKYASWLALWVGVIVILLFSLFPFAVGSLYLVWLIELIFGFVGGIAAALIDRKNPISASLSVALVVSLFHLSASMEVSNNFVDALNPMDLLVILGALVAGIVVIFMNKNTKKK